MEKKLMIGEDISPVEFFGGYPEEDDYRVIVVGKAVKKTAKVPAVALEPSWVPFVFPEKPGHEVVGHRFLMSDRYEDLGTREIPALPDGAEKTSVPNVWHFGDKQIVAFPVYRLIPVQGEGDCANCARISCTRRNCGVKCRNFKQA